MRQTKICITPFSAFDIPALTDWLSQMTAKGFRFSMTTGPFTIFEKSTPERMQIHLEPIRGAVKDDEELNALYEEAGWIYWGMFRNNFYVFACPNLQAQAHTDPETLDYALKRFLKQKTAAGIVLLFCNILLLGLYHKGFPLRFEGYLDTYPPVEMLLEHGVLVWILSALGLFCIDIAYLLGLYRLMRYRKEQKNNHIRRSRKGIGWLTALGALILLPVIINTAQIFFGLDYRPYDLESSGFVTLSDIEGEDFPISERDFYSMDYISHGGTLLSAEYWYFQQYGAFGQNKNPNDVPRLEISVRRYPLEALALLRMEEHLHGSNTYLPVQTATQMEPSVGECYYAAKEGWVAKNGQVHLPGGTFLLRKGNTVLVADYYGEQDFSHYAEQLLKMMEHL